MTYELAKQLQANGFPFRQATTSDDTLYSPGEVPLAVPTLLDLIEACGIKFLSLQFRDLIWYATGHINTEITRTEMSDTPDEAVANLWLALQNAK
jgi:hypothetical protein